MNLWDVNFWGYAFRRDSPSHEKTRERLFASLEAREPFIFCPAVASSFLRLVANGRIFEQPSEPREAWSFLDYLESRPAAVFAQDDAMAFGIFKHLCRVSDARGNEVPDAFLAALAIRHDAILVTADARMRKWPGLEL